MIFRSPLLFLALTTAPALLASSAARSENVTISDEILVQASTESSSTPDWQVYNQSELSRGFRDLGDFLQQVNGLQVQTLGREGDPVLVSMRGANANQTRVLVNGIAVNNGQYGSYDLNAIPLNQIERIEIIQAGSDNSGALIIDEAIGGTINIVTREALQQRRRIGVSGGSANSIGASLQQPLGASTSIQLDHRQSANNSHYPVPSPYDHPANAYESQPLRNARYERNSLLLSHQQNGVSASLQLQDDDKQIPDYFRNSPNNTASLASRSGFGRLEGDFSLGQDQRFYQHWSLYHSLRHESYRDPQGILGQSEDDNRYRYQQSEGQFGSQTDLGAWNIATHLQLSEQTYQSRYRQDNDAIDCDSLAGHCNQFSWLQEWQTALQTRWQGQQNQQWLLNLIQHHRSERSRAADNSALESSSNQDDWLSWLMSWRQQHDWQKSHLSWQLAIKQARRLPSLYERFGDHGLMVANDDLQPEDSQTVSLDGSLDTRLAGRPQTLSLSLFRRQLENAIVALYEDTGAGRYENTSEASLEGIEWQWRSRLNGDDDARQQWHLQLSGSHYRSLTHSDSVKSQDNRELAGIYHQRGLASLDWQYHLDNNDRWQLQLAAEIADDLWLDRANLVAGDQRRLINASSSWQFERSNRFGGEAGLRVRNLNNHFFKDYTGRPDNGRQWSLYLTLYL